MTKIRPLKNPYQVQALNAVAEDYANYYNYIKRDEEVEEHQDDNDNSNDDDGGNINDDVDGDGSTSAIGSVNSGGGGDNEGSIRRSKSLPRILLSSSCCYLRTIPIKPTMESFAKSNRAVGSVHDLLATNFMHVAQKWNRNHHHNHHQQQQEETNANNNGINIVHDDDDNDNDGPNQRQITGLPSCFKPFLMNLQENYYENHSTSEHICCQQQAFEDGTDGAGNNSSQSQTTTEFNQLILDPMLPKHNTRHQSPDVRLPHPLVTMSQSKLRQSFTSRRRKTTMNKVDSRDSRLNRSTVRDLRPIFPNPNDTNSSIIQNDVISLFREESALGKLLKSANLKIATCQTQEEVRGRQKESGEELKILKHIHHRIKQRKEQWRQQRADVKSNRVVNRQRQLIYNSIMTTSKNKEGDSTDNGALIIPQNMNANDNDRYFRLDRDLPNNNNKKNGAEGSEIKHIHAEEKYSTTQTSIGLLPFMVFSLQKKTPLPRRKRSITHTPPTHDEQHELRECIESHFFARNVACGIRPLLTNRIDSLWKKMNEIPPQNEDRSLLYSTTDDLSRKILTDLPLPYENNDVTNITPLKLAPDISWLARVKQRPYAFLSNRHRNLASSQCRRLKQVEWNVKSRTTVINFQSVKHIMSPYKMKSGLFIPHITIARVQRRNDSQLDMPMHVRLSKTSLSKQTRRHLQLNERMGEEKIKNLSSRQDPTMDSWIRGIVTNMCRYLHPTEERRPRNETNFFTLLETIEYVHKISVALKGELLHLEEKARAMLTEGNPLDINKILTTPKYQSDEDTFLPPKLNLTMNLHDNKNVLKQDEKITTESATQNKRTRSKRRKEKQSSTNATSKQRSSSNAASEQHKKKRKLKKKKGKKNRRSESKRKRHQYEKVNEEVKDIAPIVVARKVQQDSIPIYEQEQKRAKNSKMPTNNTVVNTPGVVPRLAVPSVQLGVTPVCIAQKKHQCYTFINSQERKGEKGQIEDDKSGDITSSVAVRNTSIPTYNRERKEKKETTNTATPRLAVPSIQVDITPLGFLNNKPAGTAISEREENEAISNAAGPLISMKNTFTQEIIEIDECEEVTHLDTPIIVRNSQEFVQNDESKQNTYVSSHNCYQSNKLDCLNDVEENIYMNDDNSKANKEESANEYALVLLCSENLIEQSSEATAQLSSGKWIENFLTDDQQADSGTKAISMKILLCDCCLVDESFVDVELSSSVAIKVVYLSTWDNSVSSPKELVRNLVQLASCGRYETIHLFLVVDNGNLNQYITEILMLQNALVKQGGCPCQQFCFQYVSPATLSAFIAQRAFTHCDKNKTNRQWLSCCTLDNTTVERARFLLSITPMMSVYDAMNVLKNKPVEKSFGNSLLDVLNHEHSDQNKIPNSGKQEVMLKQMSMAIQVILKCQQYASNCPAR